MKLFVEKSIPVLVIVFLTTATTLSSEESNWMFHTIYGESLLISQEREGSKYSLTFGDVTERVASCETATMRICFRSRFVDIAVPEEKPKVGENWRIAGTTFAVSRVVANLELLDEQFNDVFVIEVSRNTALPSVRPGMRKFRLFYSYKDGLIAFQQASYQEHGPIFIASGTPSLGGAVEEPIDNTS